MKVNVLATVLRVPDRIESLCRRGCVRVVWIPCTQCRAWVDPSECNPNQAVCEACVRFVIRPVNASTYREHNGRST